MISYSLSRFPLKGIFQQELNRISEFSTGFEQDFENPVQILFENRKNRTFRFKTGILFKTGLLAPLTLDIKD